jgi:subtilisin family serine protease
MFRSRRGRAAASRHHRRTAVWDTRWLVTGSCLLLVLLAFPAAVRSAEPDANPLLDHQTYLRAISSPSPAPPRLDPVKVAVLDAGIDGDHPDLAGRIAGARAFGAGDPLYPSEPHGTATAGLIAAIRGNGIGIDGIAPNAMLISAEVSDSRGDGNFDNDAINRAIRWAADQGARVINLSLASSGAPPAGQQAAIDYALKRGTLVVAAAGNCWQGATTRWAQCPFVHGAFPAWLPHVLAVGATETHQQAVAPADYSTPSSRWIDLAAPGTLITTLWPTRNNPYSPTPGCPYPGTTACYKTGTGSNQDWGLTGTSYAAAMVSAGAAILFGADPRLQPGQIAQLLEQTAQRVENDPQHQTGAGMLDIDAALARVRSGQIPPADFGEPNDPPARPASLPIGETVDATLDWSDDPQDVYTARVGAGDQLTLRTGGAIQATLRIEHGADTILSRPLGLTSPIRIRQSGTIRITVTAAPQARGPYTLFLDRRRGQ